MAKCNELSSSSDKILLVSGDRLETNLIGLKYMEDLNGDTNKIVPLLGEKFITTFNVTSDKSIEFTGEKYIRDLNGTKYLDNPLFGSLDKPNLIADGACVGWWYILVDSTLFTVDNTFITIDRTPNF